jgi:hypothetical protein
MGTKYDAAAEARARETLLENGWSLRAGHGSPAVVVAENGERTLYGSTSRGDRPPRRDSRQASLHEAEDAGGARRGGRRHTR